MKANHDQIMEGTFDPARYTEHSAKMQEHDKEIIRLEGRRKAYTEERDRATDAYKEAKEKLTAFSAQFETDRTEAENAAKRELKRKREELEHEYRTELRQKLDELAKEQDAVENAALRNMLGSSSGSSSSSEQDDDAPAPAAAPAAASAPADLVALLADAGLAEFTDAFVDNGYDDVNYLKECAEEDKLGDKKYCDLGLTASQLAALRAALTAPAAAAADDDETPMHGADDDVPMAAAPTAAAADDDDDDDDDDGTAVEEVD